MMHGNFVVRLPPEGGSLLTRVKRGKKTTKEECGYSREKIRHMPEGSYENIAIIKIKDFKPDIEYIKMEE